MGRRRYLESRGLSPEGESPEMTRFPREAFFTDLRNDRRDTTSKWLASHWRRLVSPMIDILIIER